MDERTTDMIEDLFYLMCDNTPEEPGMLSPKWEVSISLPVTPCYGEINCKNLPQIAIFSDGCFGGWYVPPDSSGHT